jgi:hypothetical protein
VWLFTRNSFLSLIADHDDPNMLVVRARMRGDIHHLWPQVVVEVSPPWRDYKYRARIPRTEVADALSREITQLSYGNSRRRLGWLTSAGRNFTVGFGASWRMQATNWMGGGPRGFY